MLFHSIKQCLISVNKLLPILFPNATASTLMKPGFDMIATIAVIAEKKKSSAIAGIIWKPLSSDRSDNNH